MKVDISSIILEVLRSGLNNMRIRTGDHLCMESTININI